MPHHWAPIRDNPDHGNHFGQLKSHLKERLEYHGKDRADGRTWAFMNLRDGEIDEPPVADHVVADDPGACTLDP